MERVIKSVICCLALTLSSHANAFTFLNNYEVVPNLGVDVGVRHQPFETGFGDEQFRDDYPLTNFYVGARVHEYFGIEGGYEHMYALQKKQFYNDFTPVLGFLSEVGPGIVGDQIFWSEAWAQGWNLNLVGYWPICKNIDIIGSVGVAWLTMYYDTNYVADNDSASRPTQWQSDDEAILRLTLGVRQMINDYFGVRLQGEWEQTSELDATIPVGFDNFGAQTPTLTRDNYTARPKDSFSLTLGFFIEFV